jgi:hypothetical protein
LPDGNRTPPQQLFERDAPQSGVHLLHKLGKGLG